jgi:hypothetical protein
MRDDVYLAMEVITALTDMSVWRLRDQTIVVLDEVGFRTVTRAELHRIAAGLLRQKRGTPEGRQLAATLRDLYGREVAWLDDAAPAAPAGDGRAVATG